MQVRPSGERQTLLMPSHVLPARRALAAAVAGLGMLTLAGCSFDGGSADAETTDPDATPTPTTESVYADGTYLAEADYMAPSGMETISVSLTLADDVVTAVTVVGDAVDHEAIEFQERFAGGIEAEVVGRELADLSVDRVSGASLTGIGFNLALEKIRAEALA
jgi:uncharacterized protein with FMN-binding domain